MIKIKIHTISIFFTQLLLAAMAIAVIFGNGLHLHLSFHDVFEHGNFHIVLHSHTSPDTDDILSAESEEDEPHQHSVATIEFTGIVINHSLTDISSIDVFQTGLFGVEDSNSGYQRIERFALPPPEIIISHFTRTSPSLRAPPAA